MSAPVTHDPMVVNTQDGCCWTRRAVNRAGRGLYALADAKGPVPELVLATLAELAEHGLSSMSMDCLPVPAGFLQPPSELDRLKLQMVELERAYAVDKAALQRRIDGLERERRESGPSAEWFAEAFSPKPAEGEHYASTHHDYRTPRDLPELGGQR